MAEPHRPDSPGPHDARYYGVFGPGQPGAEESAVERTQPLSIGDWREDVGAGSSEEPTRVLPAVPGAPSAAGWPAAALFPAPAGVAPLLPGSPGTGRDPGTGALPGRDPAAGLPPARPARDRRPRSGAAGLLALAAAIALVVGTAAGFGGARLAGLAATPQSTSAPVPSSPATPGQPSLPPAPERMNTVEVARRVLPSTVTIRVGSGSGAATGSGFVLDARGRIMTNNHVVARAADGAAIAVIFADGRRVPATLVGRSPSYDLAVIKVAISGLRPLAIGNSDQAEVGQTVVAVGSPLGLAGTVTEGIISAKDRPVVVSTDADADAASAYINGLQTDAPINPGNSGGPLVDAAARVIGVNSAILTLGQSREQSGNIGLGFAIPINQAMQIGDQLVKRGKATYPVIGANVLTAEGGEGVQLSTVQPGGPAADAGLRPGDVVTAIDGRPVYEIQDLIVAIRTHRPGQQVTLRYVRDGSSSSARVTLGSREG